MPSNREIARGVRVEIEHALASDDPPAWVDLVEQTVMTALDAKDQERDRLRETLKSVDETLENELGGFYLSDPVLRPVRDRIRAALQREAD